MPAKLGPGSRPSVAKDIFQTFLMAAMSTRQMLSLIRRGDGEIIHLVMDSKPNSIRLPVFEDDEDFYTYIRRQLEDLCACEHFLVRRKEHTCTKCTNIQQPQSTNNEEANNSVEEKRRWSPTIQQNLSSSTPQQHVQHVQQTNVQSTDSSMSAPSLSAPTPSKQARKSVPGKYILYFL